MLMLKNCSVPDFKNVVGEKRVIPFGVGNWFKTLETEDLLFLTEQCPYAIDNSTSISSVVLQGKEIPVFSPEKLREEKECVVLFVSPIYMYDMYIQLEKMNLEGSIICYGFPFMTITDTQAFDESAIETVLDYKKIKKARIPQIIHGFWFSGVKKPLEYERCYASWKKVCPDFDIVEWTKENYDISKHPFLKQAIDLEAWAFAADYARLDVLYEYGGFYLDMDVELIQSLGDLVSNAAVLGFSKSTTIDLAVLGAEPKHPLIKKLLEKYDEIPVPKTRKQFNECFQPSLVRDVLKTTGVKFNGRLQIMEDGTVFLPRTFFFPMDSVIFERTAMSRYTHAIHYDNFGWSVGGEDVRNKKLRDNRLLYGMIQE